MIHDSLVEFHPISAIHDSALGYTPIDVFVPIRVIVWAAEIKRFHSRNLSRLSLVG